MSGNEGFIFTAYGISTLVLVILALWLVIQRRNVQRDLALLESQGIKRRSDS